MSSAAVKGRIGDRLMDKGLLTIEQLKVALGEQRRHHRPLGEILVSLGFVVEREIAVLVAEQLDLEYLSADDIEPDPLLVSGLDHAFVRESMAFPYALDSGTLRILMADPENPERLAVVRERFPYPLNPAVTTESELSKLVRLHLSIKTSRLAELMAVQPEGKADDFPVEEAVEALIVDAVNRGATDIHVEPEGLFTRVRFRVDGILQSSENLPASVTSAVISRIKVMSRLDISERRRPQDGRISFTFEDRRVDMRVSVMPSRNGENIVLRILESTNGVLRLDRLGVSPLHQRLLRRIADRPHGLFLVTGPTGSGKTTTLYAMLSEVDAVHRKVATIEDPVEYQVPLLRQSQVDPAVGFNFGVGLRSLLRQDPDVILVGEIRDEETADMALKAAMTGHLVLSTLHTNSAIGAFPRLVDMNIDGFLIEDSLIGAMSQRLVRRICPNCREERAANEEEVNWLGAECIVIHGTGCKVCDDSGYDGRIALVELFLPDEEMCTALRKRVSLSEVQALARAKGFQSLEEDGKRLVRAGRTSMSEVLRVGRSIRLTGEEREEL